MTYLILINILVPSLAQDGSDIRYFKVQNVSEDLIGSDIHFDFYNRSFRGKILDTLSLTIDNRKVLFTEVRNDTGYNNWFARQWLQSNNKLDGATIKISKFKLDDISRRTFKATAYLDFYDGDNKIMADKSRQIQFSFRKDIIAEVLVKSRQL